MEMLSFVPEEFFLGGWGGGSKLVSSDTFRKSDLPFITQLELCTLMNTVSFHELLFQNRGKKIVAK